MGVLPFPCLLAACIRSFATAGELEAHLLQHMDVPAVRGPAPAAAKRDAMAELFVRGRPDEHIPHAWPRACLQRLVELTHPLPNK